MKTLEFKELLEAENRGVCGDCGNRNIDTDYSGGWCVVCECHVDDNDEGCDEFSGGSAQYVQKIFKKLEANCKNNKKKFS